ncbi:MAG: hypothetical protein RL497_473, partial [Pseudomonadota bacterium]
WVRGIILHISVECLFRAKLSYVYFSNVIFSIIGWILFGKAYCRLILARRVGNLLPTFRIHALFLQPYPKWLSKQAFTPYNG